MAFRSLGLDRRDLLIVAGLFVISRLLYAALGLRFDASPFPGYMQFIDSELLSTRLLESIWYYHANPPMFNFAAGIGYKLFGSNLGVFFAVIFHLLGLLTALCVYLLTWRFSASRIAAGIAAGLLVFSPAFVLYENWLMYSFPAVALLTMSAAALYQYALTQKSRWCIGFFSLLAILLLTRSLFHIAWMILIAALLTATMWDRRRQVLVAAMLPILVVAFWYGKNYYYFGAFSTSTWMGLGLSNISTLVVTRKELQPLVDDHRLSPYALVSRYQQIDQLFAQPAQPTGVPVLDRIRKSSGEYNFNNIQIVAIDRHYTADAVTVIRNFPFSYVIGLIISNRLFFSPPSMNLYFSDANRAAARPMERVFNPLLYGTGARSAEMRQPTFGFDTNSVLEVNTSIPLILVWWIVLGYGYAQSRQGLLSKQPARRARAMVIGFVVVTALYLYVVGTAFELAENYRYRYLIEPLFLALTVTALTSLLNILRRKVASWRPANK